MSTEEKSEFKETVQTTGNPAREAVPEIDLDRINAGIEQLKLEQNLPYAIAAGLVTAIISAFLWAAVTAASGFQLGIMAIGVGFITGYAVRFFGKGIDKIYGVIGAIFALLGCVLGNFFTIVYLVGQQEGADFLTVLFSIDFGVIPAVMAETFSFMDLVFYGIAVYEGYRFSFRQISKEELKNLGL